MITVAVPPTFAVYVPISRVTDPLHAANACGAKKKKPRMSNGRYFFIYSSCPSQLTSKASLDSVVAVTTMVEVEGVNASPESAASPETIQAGIFTNAIGNVTVHDVTTPLPAVTRIRSIFPVEVGDVPHDDTEGIVPVASQYPAPVEEAIHTRELVAFAEEPIYVAEALMNVEVPDSDSWEFPSAEPDVQMGSVFAVPAEEVVTVPPLPAKVEVATQVAVPEAESPVTTPEHVVPGYAMTAPVEVAK